MGKPTEQGLWADSLSDFSLGVNSDVPAVALPKNQLAFATNCTLRGNFATHRPPYQQFTLDTEISGLFQGASYYKPDSGPESVIISLSGALYKITPATTGTTASVLNISVPGDPNSATNPQAWLWQGENYLFCNNGESQTEIFNGNTTRRSDTGTVVGTTSAPATIAAIGTPFAVTLAAAYTGPLGVALDVFPSATNTSKVGQFQVSVLSSGGYNAILTNVSDSPGTGVPTGSELIVQNSFNGQFTEARPFINNGASVTIGVTPNYSPGPGTSIRWGLSGNFTFLVTAVSGSNITIKNTSGFNISIAAGDPFNLTPAQPDQVIAITAAPFVAPSVGASDTVVLVAPYTGANGKYVQINGATYTISQGGDPAPSTQVYLTAVSLNVQVGSTLATGAILKTLAEMPIGTIGVYGMGRNWVAKPDRKTYFASDIVGGPSGTLVNNFRDAILNVTENNYLAGGGNFYVPGAGQQINSMGFPATLDSSLGQGPLQVLTQNTVFSCNAPVVRATWQQLTNPIQTQSLVGAGALGDCVPVNGDLWFRAIDGIRSLKLARQDFIVSYGNTPQSIEMNRVLMEDNRQLLGYWNGCVFDNRLVSTATPTQGTSVYHTQLIALNLDPNSSLRGKQPPIYDGAWDGLNVLKVITGEFSGEQRCFAVTVNPDTDVIGLVELLPTQNGNNFDNDDATDGKIRWSFETPAVFYQPDPKGRQLLRLNDGEMIIADIVGEVRFDVYYRPDYSTAWTPWHSWLVPASPTYQPRMGLGQPDLKEGDTATGRPYAVGYHFQLKVIVTGACKILGMNFYAVSQSDTAFAKPIDSGLTPLTP